MAKFSHKVWPTATTFLVMDQQESYLILKHLTMQSYVVLETRDLLRFKNNMKDGEQMALSCLDQPNAYLEEFTVVSSVPYYRQGILMFPHEAYNRYELFCQDNKSTINSYVRLVQSGIKEGNVLPPRQEYTINPKFI